MSGKNNGTGQPLIFRCSACRKSRSWRGAHHRGGMANSVTLTGRTRPHGRGGVRITRTSHEYRCDVCGHTGWSCHVDLARKAAAQIIGAASQKGQA